jgi:hypothetical protein
MIRGWGKPEKIRHIPRCGEWRIHNPFASFNLVAIGSRKFGAYSGIYGSGGCL